jgi:hypothetical protein
MPAVPTEGSVGFALLAQSDHQSERLLDSPFLGSMSGGLLGFSHEGVIDFDICAHGPFRMMCMGAW